MKCVKHKEWGVSVCAHDDVHLIHKRLIHILLGIVHTHTHTLLYYHACKDLH